MTDIIRVSTSALLAVASLSATAVAWAQPTDDPAPTATVQPQPPPPTPDVPLIDVQAGGLTADDVAERAVVASPTLAARRARIAVADAQIEKTVAQFFPRVTLSATYTRMSAADNSFGGSMVGAENPGLVTTGPCPDGAAPAGTTCVLDSAGTPVGASAFEFPSPRNSYNLTAEVGIPLSDYFLTMPSAVGATRSNARANELGKRAATRDVALEARLAYHDWLRAVAATSVAQNSLERTKALLGDTKTAFELGAATRADVLRVEALVAGTELQVNQAQKMRKLTAARLAILMDESPRDYVPGQKLPVGRRATSLPSASPDADRRELSRLVAEAHANRPELASVNEAKKSLRQAVRASNAMRMPRLDGFGQLSHAKPNERYLLDSDQWHTSWAVGLRLSYTINDTFTNGAQTKELKAQRAELEAQRTELERGIRLQVTDAFLETQRAQLAVESANKAHTAASEAYRVSRELYRVGEATTTDLIEAENDLVVASLEQVNATIALEVARLNLNHVVGREPS